MQANPLNVAQLFGRSIRYCIPLFQRHYVWNLKEQWEPFWDDILSKTSSRLEDHPDVYPHFVGAIVLESKKSKSVREITSYNTIDGQQRLTTFQIFFAALRDISTKLELKALTSAINRHLQNPDPDLMVNKEIDIFKVWPTKYDREVFSKIIIAGSRDNIRSSYYKYFIGDRLKKIGYIPKLLEAYIYFYDKILEFLDENQDQFDQHFSREEKLDYLYNCFCNDFKVVEIQLDQGDDAQVIFETLNARGTPLESSDLIRNFLFSRTEHNSEDQVSLFDNYWLPYEDTFWSLKVKQGRIVRSRLEFFFLNFLTSKIAYEINHKRIFPEYKQFIQNKKPYEKVEDELKEINKFSDYYKILIQPDDSSRFSAFSKSLNAWDVTTAHPLILEVMHSDIHEDEKDEIFSIIESYLVRRAICGKTSKNYNKIFLLLLRSLKEKGVSIEEFKSLLLNLRGESGNWPDNNEFRKSWIERNVYKELTSRRVQEILKKIESFENCRFTEEIEIKSNLSVEHIMPQEWEENWPLSDGTKVNKEIINKAFFYRFLDEDKNPQYDEINTRLKLVHTFGNLTLLTQPLNSSIRHSSFMQKREHIIEQSALRLNRYFHNINEWNEELIIKRGEELFKIAINIWKYPDS